MPSTSTRTSLQPNFNDFRNALFESSGGSGLVRDRRSVSSNSRRLGLITRGSPHLPTIASCVLRPWPVMQRTALSSRGILPVSISFFAQATVTPPAVSAKMPSHSASRRMPSTTSSSVHILGEAAGLVHGVDGVVAVGGRADGEGLHDGLGLRHGLHDVGPAFFIACEIGAQPVACAPWTLKRRIFHEAELDEFVVGLVDLREQRAGGHRDDGVPRDAPAELLADFEAHRLANLRRNTGAGSRSRSPSRICRRSRSRAG